jgi:hypothetical protein
VICILSILFIDVGLGSTIILIVYTNGFTIQTTRGVMGSIIYQLSIDSSVQSLQLNLGIKEFDFWDQHSQNPE